MNYFTKRFIKNSNNKDYWEPTRDPDGNIKYKGTPEEYANYYENNKQEIDFINSLPGGRLLDVGCGVGYMVSKLDATKFKIFGVEKSKYACEFSKKWGKIFNCNLEDCNFPNEYFDIVILFHVIEHIDNPISLITEIRRILRIGGWLILGTPDFDSPCARMFGGNYRMLHDKTHISLFSQESMRRFLFDFNFKIEKVEFPFYNTKYFTKENLLRLFDTTKMSPPAYGNFMTFYCRKKGEKYEGDKNW